MKKLNIIKKDNKRRTQKEAIDFYNKEKLKFMSAPDLYQAFKEDNPVTESLKQDFKDSWIVTSTQIDYSAGTITHDKGSIVIKEKVIKVNIPVLQGDWQENKETEAYLQALFDTKDNLAEIKLVMQKMADGRTIRLWTRESGVRSVDFLYDNFDDRFYVNGYWIGDNQGLSRGVSVGKKSSSGNQGIKIDRFVIFRTKRKRYLLCLTCGKISNKIKGCSHYQPKKRDKDRLKRILSIEEN